MRPLLRGLVPTGRVAYLVAQHRCPSSGEGLTEILARDCPLPVAAVADGEAIRPDRVYVPPPGHHLEVRTGHLHLTPPTADGGVVPSIDALFASLAETYGPQAVGVLLSGTGHDGTRGAQAIRHAGGLVLAQSLDSAGQGGMVESALAAGTVDEALGPDDLAERLNALGEGPAVPRSVSPRAAVDDDTLGALLALVQEATETDFSQYKEPTLRRQVLRRMASLGLTAAADYLSRVRDDPDEARVLRQRFMISVSAFFRDTEVFAALDQALVGVVAGHPVGEAIRVWVPGCASGEEAYSIAALLAARLGGQPSDREVQVFATDLDAAADPRRPRRGLPQGQRGRGGPGVARALLHPRAGLGAGRQGPARAVRLRRA